jgi:RNA-directed DNA polymerase
MSETLKEIEPACSVELAQSKIARVISALSTGSYSHFVKLDVVDFYPSIGHDWLRAVLRQTVGAPSLVNLYMAAAETPTLTKHERYVNQRSRQGVPQGLSISNGLAELSVRHVDNSISGDEALAYFRFVDDVLILTDGDRTAELWPSIKTSLALANLHAHDVSAGGAKSSSGELKSGFEFLGYKFDWPRVSVRTASINRLESSIARTFTRYKYAVTGIPRATDWHARCEQKLQWHLDLIVSGCVFEGNRLGWLAYFSQIRHHQLLEHLDSIVRKQMTRHGVYSIEPKSFVDSYRFAASRRPDESGFVPDFDHLSIDAMKEILGAIFFVSDAQLNRMTVEEVESRFKRKIRGLVVELERDVQAGY